MNKEQLYKDHFKCGNEWPEYVVCDRKEKYNTSLTLGKVYKLRAVNVPYGYITIINDDLQNDAYTLFFFVTATEEEIIKHKITMEIAENFNNPDELPLYDGDAGEASDNPSDI